MELDHDENRKKPKTTYPPGEKKKLASNFVTNEEIFLNHAKQPGTNINTIHPDGIIFQKVLEVVAQSPVILWRTTNSA
jgi:hypothetical protein